MFVFIPAISTCGTDNFRCNDSECIDMLWRCDGDFDCTDHSDEMNCPANFTNCADTEWACKTGDRCIHKSWQCDGVEDCLDGSDEENCQLTCRPDQFQCANGNCIYHTRRCDKEIDCTDGSDEGNCSVRESLTTHKMPNKTTSLYNYAIDGKPTSTLFNEKVISKRIEEHLEQNCLNDPLQSAYRAHHSTETALLKVHHDITVALDSGSVAALVMLHLSAAFDVIDHQILLNRLESSFGITGSALDWIKSHLLNRSQCIWIGSSLSDPKFLTIGVPQGSVLDPKIYCLFARPIGDICLGHAMRYHTYADDTQLYIVIEPLVDWNNISRRLTECLNDIREWMATNMIKLNEEKTEVMVFAPKNKISSLQELSLLFGDNIIKDSTYVKKN
ncbi:hypothetical protein FSP39_022385 [Pinctada imbricata]|uniref:Reverse transcriptase domain-containing protein n=1 Tax=Pinctada imbricata TaxID=66713 RepID=A0AA88XU31_PINIB|nr:hypothetical protein FSP39_022385 [Pinctada imbricata]